LYVRPKVARLIRKRFLKIEALDVDGFWKVDSELPWM